MGFRKAAKTLEKELNGVPVASAEPGFFDVK